jgi:TRAP-type transport system small permease protein
MQEISRTKSFPVVIENIIYSISKVMGVIAAVSLLGMMLMTTGDVIGRYFFDSPIKGTWEVVGLFLVFAGTWGFAYCQMKKGHINVNIISDKLPRIPKAMLNSLSITFGIVGFGLISWRMFTQAQKYFLMPRGNTTDTLNWPYAPFMLALSIGAGVMVLMLLVDLVHTISKEVKQK